MGIIYFCWNKISGKIYIGKTVLSLDQRIDDHYSKMNQNSETTFHRALRKYEYDDFKWGVLRSNIPSENLSEWEKYYIAYNRSYPDGYNQTTGGEGRSKFTDADRQIMLRMFNQKYTCTDIGYEFDCCRTTVADILRSLGVSDSEIWDRRHKLDSKSVIQRSLETDEVLGVYESCRAASRATGISHQTISNCCRGTQSHSGGFGWDFYDDNQDNRYHVA